MTRIRRARRIARQGLEGAFDMGADRLPERLSQYDDHLQVGNLARRKASPLLWSSSSRTPEMAPLCRKP
jgi:hypothetical protein